MFKKSVLFISFLLLTGFFAFAQKRTATLQQANIAYDNLQFAAAVHWYEKYYSSVSANDKVALKIADSYWNIRQYDKAMLWYSKLSKETIGQNELLNRRLAELNAIKGNYAEAADQLYTINGFQKRAEGFRNRDQFYKDSADWSISYLTINTSFFREFTPLLLGQKFVWSTNEYNKKIRKGIMGWDANGFVRQRVIENLANIGSTSFPEKSTDSSNNKKFRFYARHYAGADVGLKYVPRFPLSIKSKGNLSASQPLELAGFSYVNYNIGHATASGKSGKIYLTVNRQDPLGPFTTRSLGILEGDVQENSIINTQFLPLGFYNKVSLKENILHGAIDPEGQYLVYSSNREEGKGGYDLYLTKKDKEGGWSIPIPLTEVNTPGNEVFSSFAPNGDLYFSSDGHPGLGGLDIYKIAFQKGEILGAIEHISYPINTSSDEFGIAFTQNGDHGYFTSDRFGSDDIISFDYQRKLTPIFGEVLECETNLKIANIPVALYVKDDQGIISKVDSTKTDVKGTYSFSGARPARKYLIYIYEPIIDMKRTKVVEVKLNTPLGAKPINAPVTIICPEKPKAPVQEPVMAKVPIPSAIEKPVAVASSPVFKDPEFQAKHKVHPHEQVLDSVYYIIYFDFDKYALTPSSIATLNSATSFLKKNPDYGFILLGHTDLKGKVDYNVNLSKNRVFAALNYMVAKGIDPKRLEPEYYGKSHPVKSGLTEDDGRFNRRVEFILIKK